MTNEDFLRIFYSNYSPNADWANIDEITWMYQEGLYKLNSQTIATNEKFLERVELMNNSKNEYGLLKNGESFSHMALKSLGCDYLVDNYNIAKSNVVYERSLIGFEVDVIDKDLHYPTECGDTNALKLERYLALPNTKKVLVLPYPHTQDVKVFEFQANPQFFDYIAHRNNFQKNELRRVFLNRSKPK